MTGERLLARAYLTLRLIESERGTLRYTSAGVWSYTAHTAQGHRATQGRTATDAVLSGREPAKPPPPQEPPHVPEP
jgi:hypothetical protein